MWPWYSKRNVHSSNSTVKVSILIPVVLLSVNRSRFRVVIYCVDNLLVLACWNGGTEDWNRVLCAAILVSDCQTKHTTHPACDSACAEQIGPPAQLGSSPDNTLHITCRKAHTFVDVSETPTKLNSVALVRTRTIPTERPPPVGEVSANFCG